MYSPFIPENPDNLKQGVFLIKHWDKLDFLLSVLALMLVSFLPFSDSTYDIVARGNLSPYPPPPQTPTPAGLTLNYKVYLPVIVKAPPLTSPSYYMKTVDPTALYELGKQLGERDRDAPGTQDSLVILDFGQPWKYGHNYGTILFDAPDYSFKTVDEIQDAVWSYAKGYFDDLGNDMTSHLTIGIGTQNGGDKVTAEHGEAWADLVDAVDNLLCGYQDEEICRRVAVVGASNMEVGFNGPVVTRQWVDGYHDHTPRKLYNFGDAQGCPPYGSCDNGWSQEDIWYISQGVGRAHPLPLNYNTNGAQAKQWYELSLYTYNRLEEPMDFVGVMTQYVACQQRPPCSGTDNTPDEGF